ncbi:MAG: hypothetical protein AAF958_15170, partial [Planctomycetota bacterium]
MVSGCREIREDLDYTHDVVQYWPLDDLQSEVAQFDGAPFDSDLITTLRDLVAEDSIPAGAEVLIVGETIGALTMAPADTLPDLVHVIVPSAVCNDCVRYNLASYEMEVDKIEISARGLSQEPWQDAAFTIALVDLTWLEPNANEDLLQALWDAMAVGGKVYVLTSERSQWERICELAAG